MVFDDNRQIVGMDSVSKKAKKFRKLSLSELLADRVGFEPTVPLLVHLISSQGRYNHFDTCPYSVGGSPASGEPLTKRRKNVEIRTPLA